MTGETFGTEERDALLRRRREVRIVTARARHFIPAHSLASALRELFNFADAASRQAIVRIDIEGEIVGDRVAGTVVERRAPCPFHGDIPFQMATDTYSVAAIRRQACRIDDGLFAVAAHMLLRISVACLACNASVKERRACCND